MYDRHYSKVNITIQNTHQQNAKGTLKVYNKNITKCKRHIICRYTLRKLLQFRFKSKIHYHLHYSLPIKARVVRLACVKISPLVNQANLQNVPEQTSRLDSPQDDESNRTGEWKQHAAASVIIRPVQESKQGRSDN